jgi:hypothetical protein
MRRNAQQFVGGGGVAVRNDLLSTVKMVLGGFGALGTERGFCKLYSAGPIFRLIRFSTNLYIKFAPFRLICSGSERYGPYAG